MRTDDKIVKYKFMLDVYIKRSYKITNYKKLKALSQHNVINVFDQTMIRYHPAGKNALVPAEILYQMFLGGAVEYTLSGFVHVHSNKVYQDKINIRELIIQYKFTIVIGVFTSLTR